MKRKSVRIAVCLASAVGLMIPSIASAQTPVTTTKVRLAAPLANQIVSGKRVVLDSDGGTEASPNFKPSAAWFDIKQGSTQVAKVNYSITGKYGYIGYWDSTTVLNGIYSVTASVKNSAGNVITSTATGIGVDNSTTATSVAVALPKVGATVSGKPNLVSDGGTISNRGFVPRRVYFTITSSAGVGTKTANATATSMGFVTPWDSTAVVNGTYTITSTAVDANSKTYVSPAVSFKVNNAIIVANSDTWGNHSGVSDSLTRANIDRAAAMGFKWFRFSWEQGWGNFDPSLVTYAHGKGIKVMQNCQEMSHNYKASMVPSFATYCAQFVDYGVDAIEIGNEWNHAQFFGTVDKTFTLQAKFVEASTIAIRGKSAVLPLISGGWAPESKELMPQAATAKMLPQTPNFRASGNAIGTHAWAYNCDSVLQCGYAEHPEWNAFLSARDVYNAGVNAGFNKPVWITEIGSPYGNDVNIWAGKNTPFTEETQRVNAVDYIKGLKTMRTAGLPLGVVFWHSFFDDENASGAQGALGFVRPNGTNRPAGDVIAAQNKAIW